MRSRIGTHLVILACSCIVLPGSVTLSHSLAAPVDEPGTQPESTATGPLVQFPGRATQTLDRVPPQQVTPTPAGVPTEVPTRKPRITPIPTREGQPTAPLPDPQAAPPDLPGNDATLPPANIEPWLPGVHNRFEITAYTCPAGTSFNLGEAAFLAACPPGLDHNATMSELLNQCMGAVDPVEVGMTCPFGMLALNETTGSSPSTVEFGLTGQGWGTVAPEIPNDSLVFCTAGFGKTHGHSNGVNTSVTLGFTWGRDWSCTWFSFPGDDMNHPGLRDFRTRSSYVMHLRDAIR